MGTAWNWAGDGSAQKDQLMTVASLVPGAEENQGVQREGASVAEAGNLVDHVHRVSLECQVLCREQHPLQPGLREPC